MIAPFLPCIPLMVLHHLILDERQHSVSAAESEQTYLEEGPEQFHPDNNAVHAFLSLSM